MRVLSTFALVGIALTCCIVFAHEPFRHAVYQEIVKLLVVTR